MPIPSPLLELGRLAASPMQSVVPRPDRGGGNTVALAGAVAAIVAIAAQRALAAGDLGRLRALIERTLDAVEPPAGEAGEGTGLPAIADAEPAEEGRRLSALLGRQRR